MNECEQRQKQLERFWEERASRGLDRGSRFHTEHTPHDLALIARYCRDGQRVIDLGAGTCDIINTLAERFDISALAVERQAQFLAAARSSPRLRTTVADLRHFASQERFDLVLLLGVISSFLDEADRRRLYERILELMAPGAVLLVKSQFGVRANVTIDKYSEELGTHYVAHYPGIDDETRVLGALFTVERFDPYPPALHRHPDTHFYFLACARR